jgi:hypothetical protein
VKKLILIACVLGGFQTAFAQDYYQDDPQPRVGRDAAAKYFQRGPTQDNNPTSSIRGASDHYLALSFSRYMNSAAYEWGGSGREDDVGGNAFGVTYRVGEWYNSMDLTVRIEYQEFDAAGEKPTKLSLMPLVTFPDASSRFPLYFGVGGGLGIFFKQIEDESPISFDYQLVAGARFFNVFENTGFFVEAGLKNHLLLLSSGQLNGTFLALGAVFTF